MAFETYIQCELRQPGIWRANILYHCETTPGHASLLASALQAKCTRIHMFIPFLDGLSMRTGQILTLLLAKRESVQP